MASRRSSPCFVAVAWRVLPRVLHLFLPRNLAIDLVGVAVVRVVARIIADVARLWRTFGRMWAPHPFELRKRLRLRVSGGGRTGVVLDGATDLRRLPWLRAWAGVRRGSEHRTCGEGLDPGPGAGVDSTCAGAARRFHLPRPIASSKPWLARAVRGTGPYGVGNGFFPSARSTFPFRTRELHREVLPFPSGGGTRVGVPCPIDWNGFEAHVLVRTGRRLRRKGGRASDGKDRERDERGPWKARRTGEEAGG
eukprot:scaffold287_cov337-Pavlova_lutheri.AAC.134